MKLSIITVVYNNVKTIKNCIDSVLSQSYKDIEYIIIDGASTDGTVQLIESYGSKISKFLSEKDDGIYCAMNRGLKFASGDIVGFLNSDDYYADEDVLSTIIRYFKKEDVDSIYGDLQYVDQHDVNRVIRNWTLKNINKASFKKGWHPAHPTFFVNRKVYQKYGFFNESLRISADYEIMLRFLEKYKISACYVPKVLVKMRVGGESNKSLKNIVKANMECYKAWKINDLSVNFFVFLLKPLSKVLQFQKRS